MNGPHLDDENRRQTQKDAIDNLAAMNLEDVHGYRDLFRRITWTLVFLLVVAAVGVGLVLAWRSR